VIQRVTMRSWESCMLGVHVFIGFWRGVLPLLTSWTSHGIGSVFRGDESASCLCHVRAFVDCCWSITEARSTFTTLIQKWHANACSSTTTRAQLRWYMWVISSVRPVMPAICHHRIHRRWMLLSRGNDEDCFSIFSCVVFCFIYLVPHH